MKMRVPVQIISFSCFLFSVTFVQGQVTCQLELTESGVVRTIPEGKKKFKAGEMVEIICSDKNQVFYKQEIFTCTDNGKWDHKPTCEEIKCQVPHNQHVYLPTYYFRGDLNLNVKRSYNCESGYRKMAVQATCKRDGWTPKQLCAEIMCDQPNITNAEIVGGQNQKYKISSRIEYKCRPGFEPEELVRITCDSQGQWTDIQTCNDGTCQEQELKNVEILFGHPGITSPYKPGHILVFRCTNVNMRFYGQRAIECQPDGRWNYPYPQCGGIVQCSQPTTNLRFVTLSDEKTVFSNFERLTYKCNEPYNENAGGVLMCQNGKWNGTFFCKNDNFVKMISVHTDPRKRLKKCSRAAFPRSIVGLSYDGATINLGLRCFWETLPRTVVGGVSLWGGTARLWTEHVIRMSMKSPFSQIPIFVETETITVSNSRTCTLKPVGAYFFFT